MPAKHFFICGLPRSRTAWLANFMSCAPAFCFHEPLLGCYSFADVETKFALIDTPFVGGAGSGLAFYMDWLYPRFGTPPIVVVERDPRAVDRSLRRLGLKSGSIAPISDALEAVKRKYPTLAVGFNALDHEAALRALWRHCLGDTPFPATRFQLLKDLRVTVDPARERARIAASWPGLQALAAQFQRVRSRESVAARA